MKRAILGLLSLAFSSSALAVPDACEFWSRIDHVPAHPGPDDVIAYRVMGTFPPAPEGAVFQRVIRTGQRIDIDLVVSDTPADAPPGYERAMEAPGVPSSGTLMLGPLPPGEYTLRATVREPTGASRGPCIADPRIGQLVVGTTPGPVTVVEVVEYHHAGLDHYFITADPAEMRDLDAGRHAGWTRTGESFFAYANQRSDRRGAPVLRWYGLPGAGLDTHFYARIGEISGYVPPDQDAKWLMEGIVFEMALPFRDGSCPARSVPVHRLWNARADTNHRYTTRHGIRDRMVALGYVAEGYGPDAVMLCAVAP